jgi:hypothetical protein
MTERTSTRQLILRIVLIYLKLGAVAVMGAKVASKFVYAGF